MLACDGLGAGLEAQLSGATGARGAATPVPRLLYLILAVSGATAMVYEMAWSRTLSMVYGSSVYGVSIMLSTYLVGIALGSWLVVAPGVERLLCQAGANFRAT